MTHLFDILRASLSSPFVSGGFVLMITGGVMAFARNLPVKLWHKLRDQFVVEVQVANTDPLFDWITLWLNDQPYSQKTRRLSATTLASYGEDVSSTPQVCKPEACAPDEEIKRPRLILSPSKGLHLLWYHGTMLWLSRSSGDTPTSGESTKHNNSFRFQQESYTLRIIGRQQGLLRELLNEAIDKAITLRAKKISAFVGVWGSWRRLRTFTPRKMESVILPAGIAEQIVAKLQAFITDAPWYQEMGIPYHFGMLFYGIPGSGKTSMIAALAGELKMNLYVLSLASEEMTDERFACLLSEIPPHSFMVLEDVDSAFAARARTATQLASEPDGKAHGGLTLTGILNALDGFMASEGSIVLMTTNHRERLDPALIRPGRVDFQVRFEAATQDQLRRLYQRFFPNCNGDAEIWAMNTEGKTMAEAQQDLLRIKAEGPQAARELQEVHP